MSQTLHDQWYGLSIKEVDVLRTVARNTNLILKT